MNIRGKIRKKIAVLLFMLMVLSSFSAFAEDGSSLPVLSAKEELKTESINKIEDNFIDSVSDDEYAEAIVYMKNQVDTMEVAKESENKLSSALTPYKTKIETRKAVINALKDNAEDTQQKLVKYLSQEEEKGNVEEYKPYYIINAVYVKATKDVIEDISYMNEVEKIYKNKIVKLDEPEITSGEVQANEDGVEWNIERIKADQAWDIGVDGSGIVVGTIDTGATWNHPALQAKWRGYNANGITSPEGNWFDPVNGTTMPVDEPSTPHGTHVLGTILGQEPDGSNKIGAAPGAKWIAAKVFTPEGGYGDDILAAAEWMLAPAGDPIKAPDIINNSWGGGPGLDEWFRPMVQAWRAAGILPVFSAGNQAGSAAAAPGSVSVPANYPESFAVGATDINDVKAKFSLRGPGPYGNIKPDVIAPGVNIRSSVPGGYASGWSGTSMAAPAVSGAAALILSANNSLSIEDVENLLKDTAVPLEDADDPGYPNNGYGYGLIDAFEAVSEIAVGTGDISGKVLISGEDLSKANINHEQKIFETYKDADVKINAEISDDVSITDAELLVKPEGKSYWILVPMSRISGDVKSGIYEGIITYDMFEGGDSIVYKIKARDYAGDVVVTQDYRIDVKFGITPGEYTQGFEDHITGWQFKGEWQWGTPSKVGPEKPFEGEKLAGTSLGRIYKDSSNSWLITPPIDLRDSSLETVSLRFHEWYDTEANFDDGYVLISNDYGETWTEGKGIRTGSSMGWKESLIDLGSYIGSQEPVFVAFRFTSDFLGQGIGGFEGIGWYIDNVRLVAKDNDTPMTPTDLTAETSIRGIQLKWNYSPDVDIAHYNIYRSETSGEGYVKIGEAKTNGFVDMEVNPDTTYYYVVNGQDMSGNISENTEEKSAIAKAFDVIFGTDFENDDGGFTTNASRDIWKYGVTQSGPYVAYSGEKLWATNLTGRYLTYNDSYLVSPSIVIGENSNPVLMFNHWVDTEKAFNIKYDYGQVEISKDDGSTWTNITPEADGKYGGRVMDWDNEEISLKQYCGETVKIRFFFHADSAREYTGWYIDDVYIIDNIEGLNLKSKSVPKLEITGGESKKEGYVKPSEPKLSLKRTAEPKNFKTISDTEVQNMSVVLSGIPVSDAVVTVVETGRSVKADPATGKFSLKTPVGKYNLVAEAYGYYSEEATVEVAEDQDTRINFLLDPKPQGTITGRVFDRYSGEPAAYAAIRVKEDSKVPSVTADENGEFTIPDVYVGDYTLKVMADGFEPGEVSVTVAGNETTNIDIPLKRFIGYDEEIVYDDGTAENALLLTDAGNGFAIRVTPSQYGKIKGANIFFWGEDWPVPGGNRIGVTLYDSDDKGNPVKLNIEPKIVDVVRGKWNYIDLSEFGFSTSRDFFIATYQTVAGDFSPAIGVDEASTYGDRSYVYMGDVFAPIKEAGIEGGMMVRARMEYSAGIPEITNLTDINYINTDTILVEGKVKADGKVNIYEDGVKIDEVNAVNKVFSKEVTLSEDESVITVTLEINGRETEPSAGKTVVKDKAAPELIISEPQDELVTNKEVINIIGTVTDDHFERLEINGEEIPVVEGAFHIRKMLDEGENIFNVKAYDLAGNITEKSIRVVVENEMPVITDLEPSEDVHLAGGDTLTVSFRSESGGQGRFRVVLPLGSSVQSDNMISMEEVEEGYYVGTCTVPNINAEGLIVEVEFTDIAGNKISATADGRINIGEDEEEGIVDLEPSQDVTLEWGETLTVSFRSGEGGAASFRMAFPGYDSNKSVMSVMREVSPGYYEGTWTAPNNTVLNGLLVEVTYTGTDENTLTATAEGKVNIVAPEGAGNPLKPLKPGKPVKPGIPNNPINPVNPVEPKDIF